jgi:hypothetical protein
MTRKLATHVHVNDEHGVSHVFGPDDELPAWAVEAITNPKAWAGDEPAQADGAETGTAAVPPAPAGQEPPAPPAGPAQPVATAAAVPPRAGAGSSLAAWQEYAATLAFDHSGAKNRDELIAQLDAAGHPTKPQE